jgi:hypothetical protein
LGTLPARAWANLALEAVEPFAGSIASRRAIVKVWRKTATVAGTGYSLAELGWLDGYAGQTVDELLAFERTEGDHNLLSVLEGQLNYRGR